MNRFLALFLLALVGCDGAGLTTYPAPTPWPAPRVDGGCKVPLAKAPPLTIPLGTGLASGVDDKLLPLGRLIESQNTRLLRTGELAARTGYAALGTGLLGTTDILPQPWALGTLGGCLVSFSAVGDHPANEWSPTAGQWATDTANGLRATGKRGPLVASTSRISGVGQFPELAYSSGYFFAIWWNLSSATQTTVHEAIIDATTGKTIVETTVVVAITNMSNIGVRVVNGFAVFVHDSGAGNFAFDVWQLSNLDAGPTTTPFAAAAAPNANVFDMVIRNATTVACVYTKAGATSWAVDFVPSTATATAWQPLDQTGVAITNVTTQNFMQDFGASGKLALITNDTAGVRTHWNITVGAGTGLPSVSYVIDGAPGNVHHVVGHTRSNAVNGEFTVLYDNNQTLPDAVVKIGARVAGVLTGGVVLCRSQALRTKTWQQGSDYYVATEFPSTVQNTRYVRRVPAAATANQTTPLATFQVREGFPAGQVSAVVSAAANTWTFADTAQIRLGGQPAGYAPPGSGIELVTISYKSAGDTTTGAPKEAIGSLFVPGGMLGEFDGSVYAEAGFAYFPEQPLLTPNVAGANTYHYKLVYTYLDATGRVWRSADSIDKSVGVSAVIGGGGSVTVACPCLRVVGRPDVMIEVYRGAINDSTTYQKVGSVINDPTVDSVNLVDTTTDAALASGEFLYTNGGVLANDSIPGFTAIAIGSNRLFGISADDPSVIWPSNQFFDGQGLRFSEDNIIEIRDQYGPLTAIAAQPNGIVIAFKQNATYAITGDGPDAAGNGGYNVRMISADDGTLNPRSVVETSLGTEFLTSNAGVHPPLFERVGLGLTVDPLSGAERYNDPGVAPPLVIVGSVLIANKNEVRYYTSDSRALVHDLTTDLWSLDTIQTGGIAAAVAYGGGAAIANTAATVLTDGTTTYADAGGAYSPVVTSPWIKLTELKGYGKFYRIQGVGENPTASSALQIELFKDFETTPFVTQSVIPGTLWDWETRYASKLSALKVRLTVGLFSSSDPGPKISAIVVQYGVKEGMRHMPASKRTA